MQKRGQFYLVAAMILAVLIIGFAVVSNYSKKNENLRIYDLKSELDLESVRVLNYALNQSESQAQIYATLNNFTQGYIDQESKDKDLYFVFGTADNLTLKGYQAETQTVKLNGETITSVSGDFNGGINPSGDSITLLVGANSYDFDLNGGQNFYFVVSQVIGENKYVVTG